MISVFYDPRQQVDDNLSFSPSAQKPRLVFEAWQKRGLPIELKSFSAASIEDLCLAHDPDYVDGVLSGEIANGFGNTFRSITESLPWTVGSMIAAATEAAITRSITASPTSGFHHAGYAFGGGYCTFNALAIAAIKLRRLGLVEKVGILDLDAHTGDGTQEIVDRLGLDFIFHRTFLYPETGSQFLSRLPDLVNSFGDCQTVFFQAGADAHCDDPLGGNLTTEQFRERDRVVFNGLQSMGIGCAFNLAGGYQNPLSKVIDLHIATMEEAVRALGNKNPANRASDS